jgi:nicotinate-nucleotide pyrophosphorylase (carboxylating)
MALSLDVIRNLVLQALSEDLGCDARDPMAMEADVTAQLIAPETQIHAHVFAKEPGVVCGLEFCREAFLICDPSCEIHLAVSDGQAVQSGQTVLTVVGNARRILTAERTALNVLQCLSGTATCVRHEVSNMGSSKTILLDTRKTLPGLRLAQKYAVTCGGGQNHRIGLYDAFLIKENHIAACGGIEPALKRARQMHSDLFLEIEVETLEQLDEVLALQSHYRVDRVMLDNFTLDAVKIAVARVAGRVPLEVSGNVEGDRLRAMAETGVDYLSMGALTKHVRAMDYSLRVQYSVPGESKG